MRVVLQDLPRDISQHGMFDLKSPEGMAKFWEAMRTIKETVTVLEGMFNASLLLKESMHPQNLLSARGPTGEVLTMLLDLDAGRMARDRAVWNEHYGEAKLTGILGSIKHDETRTRAAELMKSAGMQRAISLGPGALSRHLGEVIKRLREEKVSPIESSGVQVSMSTATSSTT